MTALIHLLDAATRLVDHLTPLLTALDSLLHAVWLVLILLL